MWHLQRFTASKRDLTWNSRWSLDIFSIEMLDDGFTFLCWLHPVGKGQSLLKPITVFNSCRLQGWRVSTCTGHQRAHSPWLTLQITQIICNLSSVCSNFWVFLCVTGYFLQSSCSYTVTNQAAVLIHVTKPPKLVPGKAHPSAGPVGVTEDASGNGLAEGLQHVLQLLLVHGQRQVGDV